MDIDIRQRSDARGEERARAAVLEMTRVVLGEVGYQQLRVEAVAARAGVPRVWPAAVVATRPLLVAEALERMSSPPDTTPSGDVRADVRAIVVRTAAFLADPLVADALSGLLAEAVRDPIAAERLAALLAARRAADAAVLLSAVARGDLRRDTDITLLLDTVFGMLLFRAGRSVPPTSAMVEKLVEIVLRGLEAPTGQAVNGYHTNGHGADGYGADGYGGDGYRVDGYRVDGYRVDGYRVDGYRVDGYRVDGHTAAHDGAAPGDQGV